MEKPELEKIKIKLEYQHTWIDHPLTVITRINDRVINLDISGQQNVVIEKELSIPKGQNKLSIELMNKNESNTIVDQNQNILQDTLIQLQNLELQEIMCLHMCENRDDIARFKINNTDNQILTKTTTFGQNGTFELHFCTPLYDWLLDQLFQ